MSTARDEEVPGPPGAVPTTAIVVVNYGSHALLERYLDWTQRPESGLQIPVVVVDNFSTEQNRAAVTALAHRLGWALELPERNLGYGGGVNLGARAAWRLGADAIVVANPDLDLPEPVVRALAAAVADPAVALVGPTIIGPSGRPWSSRGRVDVERGRITLADDRPGYRWLSGACFAVRRDVWDGIGGMDEDYFMYWEDVDLSIRATQFGELRVLTELHVGHDVGGTQNGDHEDSQGSVAGKSRLYYYYNCRSRLIFAAKHLGNRDRINWLRLTPSDARRVVSRGTFASKWLRWRTAWPAALRGSAAGVWWMCTHRATERGREDMVVKRCEP